MLFQIGEKVVFLKEAGGGVITKIEGKYIYIEDETGFERPFTKNDIGKVYGVDFCLNEELLENENIFQQSIQKKKNTKNENVWEIDLHFEELVEQSVLNEKLSQEQILNRQINVFKDFYDKARKKKIKRIIVIHGFGKGILRDEIHVFLKGRTGIEFFDAPYDKYGHGATQIDFF